MVATLLILKLLGVGPPITLLYTFVDKRLGTFDASHICYFEIWEVIDIGKLRLVYILIILGVIVAKIFHSICYLVFGVLDY